MSIWTQNVGREMLVTELPVIASLSALMHGERFLLLRDETAVVDSLSGQVRRELFSSSEAISDLKISDLGLRVDPVSNILLSII